jgi:hypothetical protein
MIFQMQIFRMNEFFAGLTIPKPEILEPLSRKFPPDVLCPEGLDFLQVAAFHPLRIFYIEHS